MPTSVRWAARACLMASLLGLGAAVPITSAATSTARGTNPPASAPPRAQGTSVSPAAAGAGWIARDFSSAGAVVDQDSHLASQSDTATAILALAAAGDGSNQVRAGAVWLEHNFKTYLTDEGTLDTGRLGLLILAAVAGRRESRHVRGRHEGKRPSGQVGGIRADDRGIRWSLRYRGLFGRIQQGSLASTDVGGRQATRNWDASRRGVSGQAAMPRRRLGVQPAGNDNCLC